MDFRPYQFMIHPTDMEPVCDDTNGGKWKYDATNKKYVRFADDGTLMAHISGIHLPDPILLWEKRVKIYGKQSREAVKPQPATMALWEHWTGVANA